MDNANVLLSQLVNGSKKSDWNIKHRKIVIVIIGNDKYPRIKPLDPGDESYLRWELEKIALANKVCFITDGLSRGINH